MVIDGKNLFAKYSTFNIKDESDSYRLHLGSYSGTVGEELGYGMSYHNGQAFTTLDRDNDRFSSKNCAVLYRGGWWYDLCQNVNLNASREASTLPIVFWSRKLCFQTSRRTRLPDPSGSRSVQLPTTGPHNPQTVVTDYSPSLRTGRTTAVDFKAYKYIINLNIIVFWPNWV
ncbi:angiopoietin-related protein 1-like [Elysia marginata]|uniref:Angiopoietin-related protein 1-like n=1 Tax=Elysia marginata TaxID=1093978 RepID=A0AAV4JEZ1_9GAST|nr:angiopoietin-related protein 1-like [Elysia marginata]